jgi:hypothetical protein
MAAGVSTRAAVIRSQTLVNGLSATARVGGPGEYWAYRGTRKSAQMIHYDQFSGFKGIVICWLIEGPEHNLPTSGGILISTSANSAPEVTLFKGSCYSVPQ